jgi:Domain of unknown function (DUF4410)
MLTTLSNVFLACATLAVTLAPSSLKSQSRDFAAHAIESSSSAAASEISSRPALIVQEFSVSDKTGWPYDVKQLQSQTVAELRSRSAEHLDVLVGAPATARVHSYTLAGEIVAWRPGNRAKRMVLGMGSGRESAEIHYWLTDEQGKRVFEHKDTIRAEFWGNAYEGSVGQLAHPFASKISSRLLEAKLF